jgi:hypothetical protein
MEQSEHIAYWLKSAAHDLESAETLFQQFTQNSFTRIKELYQWLLQQM